MGEFSVWHLLLILGVVLIFFGPSRLPGLGNSLGKAIRGFKNGIKEANDEINGEHEARRANEPLPPPSEQKTSDKEKTKV